MNVLSRWLHRAAASGIADSLGWTKLSFWRFGLLVPAMALVTACGGGLATTPSSPLSVSYTSALPVESQLIAGSLLLEESDLAIGADQAAELLLLWKAFRSLSNSETSAQVEIDAVITQIEETMSAEQLGAIGDMQLTSDDLAALFQQHATQSLDSAESTSGTGSSAGLSPAGGFPAGSALGPGGGDGMAFLAPSAGQGTILSAASTEVPSENLTTTSRSADGAAIRLVDPLIAMLESKADA